MLLQDAFCDQRQQFLNAAIDLLPPCVKMQNAPAPNGKLFIIDCQKALDGPKNGKELAVLAISTSEEYLGSLFPAQCGGEDTER